MPTRPAGQALEIVHYRGGDEEFGIAARLAQSDGVHDRRVAADILAQLGACAAHSDESCGLVGFYGG
jgi:hypothetical protein